MNFWWLTVSAFGLGLLALSSNEARRPAISATEARVFHAVNRLPNWLYWPLWLPMQLGNLVVGTLVGIAVAWAAGDWWVAAGVVIATISKLGTEKIVRRQMADYLAIRQRPGTSQVGAIMRGDVPSSGASFPSGHVILVAAIATVVAPTLPGRLVVGSRPPDAAGDVRAGVRGRPQPPRRDRRPRRRTAGRRHRRHLRALSPLTPVVGGFRVRGRRAGRSGSRHGAVGGPARREPTRRRATPRVRWRCP